MQWLLVSIKWLLSALPTLTLLWSGENYVRGFVSWMKEYSKKSESFWRWIWHTPSLVLPFTIANKIPCLLELNKVRCLFFFPVFQSLYCIYPSHMPTLDLTARHHHTCFQPQAPSRVSQAWKTPNKKTFVLETKPYLERSVSCHCSRRRVRHEGVF